MGEPGVGTWHLTLDQDINGTAACNRRDVQEYLEELGIGLQIENYLLSGSVGTGDNIGGGRGDHSQILPSWWRLDKAFILLNCPSTEFVNNIVTLYVLWGVIDTFSVSTAMSYGEVSTFLESKVVDDLPQRRVLLGRNVPSRHVLGIAELGILGIGDDLHGVGITVLEP